jgi:protein-tyrosine-phosphatase
MAAALLGGNVKSAGLAADDTVDPFACAVMAEIGIDITGHVPAAVKPGTLRDGLVIALSLSAFETARQWRAQADFELDYWDLPAVPGHDGGRDAILDGYRAIREALKAHIANRFANL